MQNFIYKNPTKIIFGKDVISKIDNEIPTNARVLITYGGGSIKRNGIYNQVIKALGSRYIVEFGGIPANPEFDLLCEGVALIKEKKLDFILAVGGGSVIDGTKFISAAAKYNGEDPWDIVNRKATIKDAMPFATVLTLPATGSEMNSGAVISRRSTKTKLSFGSPLLYPQFSVLDPSVIKSLPERQIVNGVIDSIMHTLEQYMTYPAGGLLQDRIAEGILQTLIEVGPRVKENPLDYEAASNFMWSCTMALNGLIAQGVPSDWTVHALGHELTALYMIDHARTLAIVAPRYYEYLIEQKEDKLAQFATRVWNIQKGSKREKALMGIRKLEEFMQNLGVETHLSAYTENYTNTAEEIRTRFSNRGWKGLGEKQSFSPEDAENVIKMTY